MSFLTSLLEEIQIDIPIIIFKLSYCRFLKEKIVDSVELYAILYTVILKRYECVVHAMVKLVPCVYSDSEVLGTPELRA